VGEHARPSTALPPFETFWGALQKLFAWLEGAAEMESLASVPLSPEARAGAAWSPPATVRTWGIRVPLETIRLAASNLLRIRLGYNGTTRIVEPYSLLRTLNGNLLLHAIRCDSRESRTYRVDRIESVEVTDQTFRPAYQAKFSETGAIRALPTTTGPRTTPPRPRRATGPVYGFQCPHCQKLFRRKRYSATLRPHKDKYGYPCSRRLGTRIS
jgi:hypothetical protein